MNYNSHLWFSRLPYSAFYRFLQKSGICAKHENIVGVKDVVKNDQRLKEIHLFNKYNKNKYSIYFNAFGRCYPSSDGKVHSYIYVEDEKFDKALPYWFKLMREASNNVEFEHRTYVEDFYDYYNDSISSIFDGKLERMEKRGNYTEEQFDQVRNEKQAYYDKLCNIVKKYMPIIDLEEETEESINYDEMDDDNPVA